MLQSSSALLIPATIVIGLKLYPQGRCLTVTHSQRLFTSNSSFCYPFGIDTQFKEAAGTLLEV